MIRSDDDRHAALRAVQRDLRAPRAAGVAEATKELKAALDDAKKQEA